MIRSHDSIRQFDNLAIWQFDYNGIGIYLKQWLSQKRQPLFKQKSIYINSESLPKFQIPNSQFLMPDS